MVNWTVEIWIEETGVDSEGKPFDAMLTQVQMNRVIEKACAIIDEEYEDVTVTDFDAHIDKEDSLNERSGL